MDQRDLIAALGKDFLQFWDYWYSLPKIDCVPSIAEYLDTAPAHIQPNVSMMDTLSATEMRVRLMGTEVVQVTGEFTGSDGAELYDESILEQAANTVWKAATFPCGYIVSRVLNTKSGLQIDMNGLVLPLSTKTLGCKTVVAFNGMSKSTKATVLDKGFQTVHAFGAVTWIDIGAGVPD